MPSFVKHASVFTNKRGIKCVEVKYSRYIEGKGYVSIPGYFETDSIGGWTSIKPIDGEDRYDDFLNTMVKKTITTRRQLALIELDNVLCSNYNVYSIIRIMNTVKILDPTFVPPFINTTCAWQKAYIRDFCVKTFPEVIHNCRNDRRLDSLFNVLQMIERGL
jgi:hypothetical protein